MMLDAEKNLTDGLVVDADRGVARRGLMRVEGREKGEGETEKQARLWRGRRGRKRVGLIFSTAGGGVYC